MSNIIRTRVVELSVIPAVAYKQKLQAGGAGIKIMLMGSDKSAVCTIDKRTGDLIPYGRFDESVFSQEAFNEAFELVNGLPYSARGKIKPIAISDDLEPEDVIEEAPKEQIDMTLSPEYTAIIDRYSDEKGKLNYQLMNKDFIQFASKSKIVTDMVKSGESQKDVLTCIVKSRATFISGRKESLDDKSVNLLIETLDEIDPRSAFKELKAHIKRMLTKNKK